MIDPGSGNMPRTLLPEKGRSIAGKKMAGQGPAVEVLEV